MLKLSKHREKHACHNKSMDTVRKKIWIPLCFLILGAAILMNACFFSARDNDNISAEAVKPESTEEDDFIKWVDFNVPKAAMYKAISLDVLSRDKETIINWIELLAYLAAKTATILRDLKKSNSTRLPKS